MAGDRNWRDTDRDDFDTDDKRHRGSYADEQRRERGDWQGGQQRGEQHSPSSFSQDRDRNYGSNTDFGSRSQGGRSGYGQQGGYERGYGQGGGSSEGRRGGHRPYGGQQAAFEDRTGYGGRSSSDYGADERWTGEYGRPGSRGSGEFAGGGFGQRGDYTRSDYGSSANGGRDFGGRDFGSHTYGQGGWANEDRSRDWSDRSGDLSDRSGGWSGRSYGGSDRGWSESGRSGDRGFWDKASDEVSSWFGDKDAERRRKQDEHRGRGPKSYSRSDDRIKEDVNDRLTDEGSLDATEIDVSVMNQEVTLSGSVSSRNDKRRAEDIAEAVSGVKHVQNNLRVNNDARSTSRWGGGSSGSSSGDRQDASGMGTAGSGSSGSSTTGGSPGKSNMSGGASTASGTGTGSSTGTSAVTGSTIGTKSTP